MGLGTKNRQKQTADICKQHLREKYRDQRGLVKNSFWSLRVTVKTAMSLVGTGSPTSKTLKKRCSSASRHISRSGLIRELNGTRTNFRRAGKDRQRTGVAKRGGEALTPW